ncbi:hypothetical protein ABW21_db0203328 [Orbilia brochopaga]|nr:hypothetical protein ABW21_db0203328 [Drechslerella brochopaga]
MRRTEALYEKQTTREREPQLKKRNLPPSSVTPDPQHHTVQGRISKCRPQRFFEKNRRRLRRSNSPANSSEEANQAGFQIVLATAVCVSGKLPGGSDNHSGHSMSIALSSTGSSTNRGQQIDPSDRLTDIKDAGSAGDMETDTKNSVDNDVATTSTLRGSSNSGQSEAQAAHIDVSLPYGVQEYLREPGLFSLDNQGGHRTRDLYLQDQRAMSTGIHLEGLDVTAMFPVDCMYRYQRRPRSRPVPYILHEIRGGVSTEGPSPPAS